MKFDLLLLLMTICMNLQNAHIFVPYGTEYEELIHGICYDGGGNNDIEIEKLAIKLEEEGKLSVIRSYFLLGPYVEDETM